MDLAIFQQQNTVAGACQSFIVRCDDNHRALLPTIIDERGPYFIADSCINVSRRLVRQDEFWSVDQGPGDCHSLLLAAGKTTDSVLQTLTESDFLQGFSCSTYAFAAIEASHHQRHCHILNRIEVWEQIVKLEDETDLIGSETR